MEVPSLIRWSGALLGQDKVGAGEALSASVLLCLGLKGLDAFPNLRQITPTGSGALLEDPTTRGTNTKRSSESEKIL